MTKKTDTLEALSFEQALQELEIVVRKLEEGRLPLEEAIRSYERGVSLKNQCETKLREAKLRVDQITLASDGSVEIKPFEEQNQAIPSARSD